MSAVVEASATDRLLILACSATKRSDEGRISARDRYDGPLWQTLRTVDPDGRLATTAFLSAQYGFGAASKAIKNYNTRLTPTLAAAMIAGGMTTRWPRPPSARRPDTFGDHPGCEIYALTDSGRIQFSEVCLVGGGIYLEVMRSFVDGFKGLKCLPRDVSIIEINGPIGKMRQSLRSWLEQGASSNVIAAEAA